MFKRITATLAVLTSLAALLVGVTTPASAASCANMPLYGTPGQRIKHPDSAAVYLVDGNGKERAIPNETVYFNLFDSWSGIVVTSTAGCLIDGVTLYGARLIKTANNPSVYIIDGNYKRGIPSEAAFNKYGFSWSKIAIVSQSYLDSWPTGAYWS